jgi:ATP-dependent helicase/nuclease subunit A
MRLRRRLYVSEHLQVHLMGAAQLALFSPAEVPAVAQREPQPQPQPSPARPPSSTPQPSPARGLTDEQEQAIARRQGSLLLAAGAGSGKTSVLVERFVRAVLDDGLAPGRILAITFTERAAGELKERIRARFIELDAREAARDTEAAFIGTFHGFCARLLRTHPLAAALDPDFTVLDEPHSGRLREQAFSAALGSFLTRDGSPAVDLVAAYGADRLRGMVLGVYAQLRSQGLSAPALPVLAESWPEDADAEGARACALLDSLLQDFAARYSALKRARSRLDFDDLELLARELLERHEDVRRHWSERLELLMVDEFQDTNPRQLAVLRALERENLFTVGDELQSIYGFRHADVGLFRARRAELDKQGSSLALTWNFRSRPPLLAAINVVFATRFGDAYTPLRAGREVGEAIGPHEQATTSNGGSGVSRSSSEPPIELLLSDRRAWNGDSPVSRSAGASSAPGGVAAELPSAPRWRQAEARLLASRIAELVQAGRARPGEVAVLLRSVGDLPLYQRALEAQGLRTLAAVGSFWGHQQVGDLLAWLRVLANPLDEVALYSVLASPLIGVSSDALALLARAAQADGRGVWETIRLAAPTEERSTDFAGRPSSANGLLRDLADRLPAADRERLQAFAARMSAERAVTAGHTLGELLRRALRIGDYEAHVLSLPWGERRLANIHKLVRLAVSYEAQEGRDLRGFLDHVAHQQDEMEGAEPEAPAGELEPDAVRLLSIHAAKGLEFPVVCLADLGRVPPSTAPSLLLDGPRVGLRLQRLDGSEAQPTLHYADLLDARRQAEAEEEERIFYVAMTRARELLLLSGAVDFERWPAVRGGSRLAPAPIAWLAPALVEDLPTHAAALETPVQVLPVHGAEGVSVRCVFHTPAFAAPSEDPRGSAVHSPAQSSRQRPAPPSPTSRLPRTPLWGPSPKKMSAPIPLSYTALSELERCGYRYYLERILRLPERAAEGGGGGLAARARGVLVHRLLQALDFASPPSPREVGLLARELGLAVSPRERQELSELLRRACSTTLARRLQDGAMRREHPFAFSLDPAQPLVTGVFDVLLAEPSGSLVVDYKSDRLSPEEDPEARVRCDYGAQRLLYALAVLRSGAPRVEVIHWFLARPHDWVSATYLAADIPALQAELSARAERVHRAGFAVAAAPHRGLCLTCPGRATLCSWSDAETLRDAPAPAAGSGPE